MRKQRQEYPAYGEDSFVGAINDFWESVPKKEVR